MNKFKISVIMSVYNVEPYIKIAVDSVINQTLDFRKNIQIIFIDDGSTDKSGEICDQYHEKYPENIIVIHKENEGQAIARFIGISKAEGEFINFLDPDDILTLEVMEKIVCFFDAVGNSVDIAAIPLVFFGNLNGPHPLNDKFEKGTRVIDLLEEWNHAQLSLASSFIRREALSEFGADPDLISAEDAKEIIKILIRKNKIGVVNHCSYKYRKRSDSTLSHAQDDPGWYTRYLEHFSEWALKYTKKKLGFIPKYIQFTVLYDLQWKLRPTIIKPGVLSPEEELEYQEKLFSFSKYFDDDVILSQKSIYAEHKLYLLWKKYGRQPKIVCVPGSSEYQFAYDDILYKRKIFNTQSIFEKDKHIPNYTADKTNIQHLSVFNNASEPLLSNIDRNSGGNIDLSRQNSNFKPKVLLNMEQGEMVLFNENVVWDPSKLVTYLENISVEEDKITIEFRQVLPSIGLEPKIYADATGSLIPVEIEDYDDPMLSAGVKIGQRSVCKAVIPFPVSFSKRQITFASFYGDKRVDLTNIRYQKFFPVNPKVKGSHYYTNGMMISISSGGITVTRMKPEEAKKREQEYNKSLIKSKNRSLKNIGLMRTAALYCREKKKKQIWLICDKADRADDNGEAFFEYVQRIKPANVDAYFLLRKDSPDYERLKKIGKVIPYMSRMHRFLYLIADCIITAYSHEELNNPFLDKSIYYSDLLQNCKYVFLQHGIIKDDLSKSLHRFHKNIKLFVVSTEDEYRSIIDNPKYGYSKNEVIMTGLPRYDKLYHDEKKEIAIMPTWRRNLVSDINPATDLWELLPGFEQSDYYQFYASLLNNERLLKTVEKHGYTINFIPHPVFQPYLNLFKLPKQIKVYGEGVRYREVFAHNKLMVTDYSSVFFDFAYLEKPVIYAHFDANHYAEGYFDYERDGFGPVTQTVDETIDQIISYLEKDCQPDPKYLERAARFFTFHDQNNCKRVFEKVQELLKEKSIPASSSKIEITG